ncbi:MAG: prepilin-type N-terminal cleavage/methylation domain-containing protein, partial [Xanthomonadales bacterium]|nr:prepilin-type N-terminal cleavage/methylation domain-containing protein [Xanthomonadales bacterium]
MKQKGFSIVELMVSLVVGVLVILGVTQVFTSSFRANTEAIQYTQLNEQLRAVSNTMSREIRRAGFWNGSIVDVKGGAQSNPFAADCDGNFADPSSIRNCVQTFDQDGDGNDDCIIYGYDADEDGSAADAGEWRGFRFTDADNDGVGLIEVKTSGTSSDANCTAGTWQTFLDEDVVEITNLTFNFSGINAPSTNRDAGNWVKLTDDCPDSATE